MLKRLNFDETEEKLAEMIKQKNAKITTEKTRIRTSSEASYANNLHEFLCGGCLHKNHLIDREIPANSDCFNNSPCSSNKICNVVLI